MCELGTVNKEQTMRDAQCILSYLATEENAILSVSHTSDLKLETLFCKIQDLMDIVTISS